MSNQTEWSIDQTKSIISFKVSPLIFASVEGSFKTFSASIHTIGNDFNTVRINLLIDASSINTGDMERDEHLKSVDFFDVQNYKQIKFISKEIKLLDSKGSYELAGDLTIKGITKEARLTIKLKEILDDPYGNKKAEFAVAGQIHRKEWGLTWNESMNTGGLMESELVTISCKITLIKLPLFALHE